MKRSLFVPAAVTVAALLGGCPTSIGGVVGGDKIKDCTPGSEDCGAGFVCSQGECIVGQCDPILEEACDEGDDSALCCKPWELCSDLAFSCQRDPTVTAIGCPVEDANCTPCEVDDDCPAAGQFCSGGRCFDTAGRNNCTSSFQCPATDRCDRTVFLCVPNRGGCQFAEQFPELRCEDGQVCSDQSGFCIDVPEPECETNQDCDLGTFCDGLQRCAECDDTHECGPGLECDLGQGTCFPPAAICTTDDDCNGNMRCASAVGQCVVPDCEDDSTCRAEDTRKRCDLTSFLCFLPPAVCDEADEPNQSLEQATPMEADLTYSGTLCRGDTDLVSFPVIPNKRYTATINYGGSAIQAGNTAAMLDTNGQSESNATFSSSQSSVTVVGVTGPDESGLFYVRNFGSSQLRDQWTYSVSVREDEPSQPADCTPAGQPEEPNNDFATATALTLDTTRTFSRCTTSDADFYKVDVPPLHGLRVVVAAFSNAEANINVDLFKAANTQSRVANAGGTTTNDIEIVNGPEGVATYYLQVKLLSATGALINQTYSITATAQARPDECSPDPTEDDGSTATAATLPLTTAGDGTVSGELVDVIRCNPQDVDIFSFTMPPNLGGSVQLHFVHNDGDMALDLLDASGTQIATSNGSNANSDPDEQVVVPGSTVPVDYFARVRLAGTTGGTIGQKYRINLATFDNGQCIASEPDGADDTFARGRCLGTFTPAGTAGSPACVNESDRLPNPLVIGPIPNEAAVDTVCAGPEGTVDGCYRSCGNNDQDFYRVGPLNNDQTVVATLDYDHTEGALQLVMSRLNAMGNATDVGTAASDTDNDGHVLLTFVAPPVTGTASDHAVRVKPTGITGHQAQRYALNIAVGAECFADVNDVGAAANESPAASTIIRSNPTFGVAYNFDSNTAFTPSASRCNNDVDVYEMFVFSGETLTVTLTGSPGLIADLGTRPSPLTNPAVAIGETATSNGGPAVYDASTSEQIYITVKPAPNVTATGPYRLQVGTVP